MNIQKAMENGPVEIVDFPIKNGDFPLLFVCSPEGIIVILQPILGEIHGDFRGLDGGRHPDTSISVGAPGSTQEK